MTGHDPVFIGPFEVVGRVARGGSAEVWLGRHGLYGTPAALKVLGGGLAERARARLHTEVRAMAAFDHPGIASVLDTGVVDRAAEVASSGAVEAGRPWLAIEYLPHGDLSRLGAPLPWALLAGLIGDILDGLAHAHAHGVVHRDLKPGNVLLRAVEGGVRAVLTDFGVAHLTASGADDGAGDEVDDRVAGTPRFMAPEQIRGVTHAIGAATDLYALGCLAFSLTAGAPPFDHADALTVTTMHLIDPVPALPTTPSRPPGFEAWVRRLLEKAPADRFECAADARRAFDALGSVPEDASEAAFTVELLARLTTPVEPSPARVVDVTRAFSASTRPTQIGLGETLDVPPESVPPAPGRASAPSGAPAVVEAPTIGDWRTDEATAGLVARVGPALFGVRTLPFVGREGARDALWAALRTARAERRPRLVQVEGAAGLGRRRLVDWLVHRAAELGAATTVHARHGPGAGDGLAAALRRAFGGERLAGGPLSAQVQRRVDRAAPDATADARREVAHTLFELMTLGAIADQPGRRERHFAAIERWMRWASRGRTLIVRLDDAQWGEASLAFASRLLEADDLAALVVMTVRSGSTVGEREGALIERLVGRPQSERVELAPLTAGEMRRLLVERIGLAPALADAVAGPARGRPHFAVQVVADWLAAGAVRPGPAGLDASPPPPVPADERALGRQRLARVVAESGVDAAHARAALEAAAALGEVVESGAWAAVVGEGSIGGLARGLLDAGLARPTGSGWRFTHGFVRAALIEAARAGGRWRALNAACAAALRDDDPTDPRSPERRAHHLAESGDSGGAGEALLEAARRALRRGWYRQSERLLRRAGQRFDEAGVEPEDARRTRVLALRAEAARHAGRSDEAMRHLALLRDRPLPTDAPWVAAELARLDGQIAFYAGETQASIEAYRRAAERYSSLDDAMGHARSLHGLGISLAAAGDADGIPKVQAALRIAEQSERRVEWAWALHALSALRLWAGRPGQTLAERAAEVFEALGMPTGHAFARLTLGEHLGVAGRVVEARRHIDAATAVLRAAESALLPEALLGSARLSLRVGQIAEATVDLAEVVDVHLDRLNGHYRGEALVGWAHCLLCAEAPRRARAAFDRGAAELGRSMVRGCPTAETIERAALAFAPVDAQRGAIAWRLAAHGWAPHRPRRAAHAEQAAAALDP